MARILLAEDEAHIARVLSLWLGRQGHETLEAPNGAVALEILGRERVDLIICDMNMPVVDGAEVARIVREELALDMPILMITARCDQAQLAEQMTPLRVKLYPKPFVPSRLLTDIDQMLSAATL